MWSSTAKNYRGRIARGGLESLCCIPFNVTGLPAISLCCGFSKSGLPLGLQIVAGSFQEDLLLQAADAYERLAAWHSRRPAMPLKNPIRLFKDRSGK